jgi:catechol 2,3-dioxygenase-like lactoylglutathione lyase family enzyme
MFTRLFPILASRDLDAALHFYRDLLGGRVTYEFPGPDGRAAYVGGRACSTPRATRASSGRRHPDHRDLGRNSTKPGWREPGFDRVCVVAGDGFEPPTFGL